MSDYEINGRSGPSHAGPGQTCTRGCVKKVSFRSRVKRLLNGKVTHSVNLRRKSRQNNPERTIQKEVTLEKVYGITAFSGNSLACDPNTGVVAYPAGQVVVLLHPKNKNQSHIFNTSRNAFSAAAFSQDGKYLVTGEHGDSPCVRVWDVSKATQLAEVKCHQSGVTCVVFSANSRHVVSAGCQQDLSVCVWDWRKGVLIASNKVFSKVLAVSFSEDGSYFVTAGNRMVKFWYLGVSGHGQVNSTVPLIGRSALLGEQWNSTFCGVACGRSHLAGSTYCITSRGLLCLFNSRRLLEAWVDIKTTSALCLSVSKDYIFCGCADATVRVFNPLNLCYITTLPLPCTFGTDMPKGTQTGNVFAGDPESDSPDTLALTFDPVAEHLTCVYSDHSVYVWDARDIRNLAMVHSAIFHSGSVWSVETYPDVQGQAEPRLPAGSILTCSSDSTIRMWVTNPSDLHSTDSVVMPYVGIDVRLRKRGEAAESGAVDVKSGARVLRISPDGRHLASGDWAGTVRVFCLPFLNEVQRTKAHDSEVLCLEFSPAVTGVSLLASAGRDGFIHIFNAEKQWSLEEMLCDHSAPVASLRFWGAGPDVGLVGCGEKSLSFYNIKSLNGKFSCNRRIRVKTSLNDMDLDPTLSHSVTACQDGKVRVYSLKSGRAKECFRGCPVEGASVLRVHMDPSGTFVATISSDNSICVLEYSSGECVAFLFGHSGTVTGMQFSHDCQRLITVSEDSCVFVWLLTSEMTATMRKNLRDVRQQASPCPSARQTARDLPLRTQADFEGTHTPLKPDEGKLDVTGSTEQEEGRKADPDKLIQTPVQNRGVLPIWARQLVSPGSSTSNPVKEQVSGSYQPQGKWAERLDPDAVLMALETQSLQPALTPSPVRDDGTEVQERDPLPEHQDSLCEQKSEDSRLTFESTSAEAVCLLTRCSLRHSSTRADFLLPSQDLEASWRTVSFETSDCMPCPPDGTSLTSAEGEHNMRDLQEFPKVRCQEHRLKVDLSLDSACGMGSAESQTSDQALDALSGQTSLSSSMEELRSVQPALLSFPADASSGVFDTHLREMQSSTEKLFPGHVSNCFFAQLRDCKRGGNSSLSTGKLGRLSSSCSKTTVSSKQKCVVPKDELKSPDVQDKGNLFQSAGQTSAAVSGVRRTASRWPQHRSSSNLAPPATQQSCTGTADSSHGQKHQCSSIGGLQKPVHRRSTMLSGQRAVSSPALQTQNGPRQSLPPSATWCTPSTTTAASEPPPSVDRLLLDPHISRADADFSGPLGFPLRRLSRKSWRSSTSLCLVHEVPSEDVPLSGPGEGAPNVVEGFRMNVRPESPPSPTAGPVFHQSRASAPGPQSYTPGASSSAVLSQDGTSVAQSHAQLSDKFSCFPTSCPGGPAQTQVLPREGTTPPDSGTMTGPVNMNTCEQIVRDLEGSVKMAVGLYKLCLVKDAPEQRLQMRSLLADTFSEVRRNLDGVFDLGSVQLPDWVMQQRGGGASALLERYSDSLEEIAAQGPDGARKRQ